MREKLSSNSWFLVPVEKKALCNWVCYRLLHAFPCEMPACSFRTLLLLTAWKYTWAWCSLHLPLWMVQDLWMHSLDFPWCFSIWWSPAFSCSWMNCLLQRQLVSCLCQWAELAFEWGSHKAKSPLTATGWGYPCLHWSFHLKSWSLSSDLINSSNISLLIGVKRQDTVLTCNVSGLVAEQRSLKGRIHNPLKGEESQRGFGGHLLCGEKQSLCEALPLCDQFLSLFHISSLSSRRQIEMKPAMTWPL